MKPRNPLAAEAIRRLADPVADVLARPEDEALFEAIEGVVAKFRPVGPRDPHPIIHPPPGTPEHDRLEAYLVGLRAREVLRRGIRSGPATTSSGA